MIIIIVKKEELCYPINRERRRIMYLNESQTNKIYQIITKYQSDETFRQQLEETYENEVWSLSALELYALEEILRYGTKGIFEQLLKVKGTDTESETIDLYDQFNQLLKKDPNFKQRKIQQLVTNPETLSKLEKLIFSLISKSKREGKALHDDMTKELQYDPLNPILYQTEEEIKTTLENLLLGKMIHQMLALPEMKSISVRQREKGQLEKKDKERIISQIKNAIPQEQFYAESQHLIEQRVLKVKLSLLLKNTEQAFEPYVTYNTNISVEEIYGKKKEPENEAFQFFKEYQTKKTEKHENN